MITLYNKNFAKYVLALMIAVFAIFIAAPSVVVMADEVEPTEQTYFTDIGQGKSNRTVYMLQTATRTDGPTIETREQPKNIPTKSTKIPVEKIYFYSDEDYSLPVSYLNQQIVELYGEKFTNNYSLNEPGWHFLWREGSCSKPIGTDFILGDNILYDVSPDGTFNGIKISNIGAGAYFQLTYNYYPEKNYNPAGYATKANFPIIIEVHVIARPSIDENGAIFGEDTIPAATQDGQYFFGTQYIGYEEVISSFSSKGSRGIYLPVLVNMLDHPQEGWLPTDSNGTPSEHVNDWTATSGNNFEVAYCADSDTTTSNDVAEYKIANLKGLENKFNSPEDRERLQAIIEHSYPFITEEEMLKNIKDFAGDTWPAEADQYASEIMMTATQLSIWNITNPTSNPDHLMNMYKEEMNGFSGASGKTYIYTIINEDRTGTQTLKRKLTADDFINSETQSSWWPKQIVDKQNDASKALTAVMDYLSSCTSSIDPKLNVNWTSSLGDDGLTFDITATGTIAGYVDGDTFTINGEVIPVNEDGTFEITLYGVEPNTNISIDFNGSRNTVEGKYYESTSGHYQNFVGGMFNTVPVSLSANYSTQDIETTSLSVNKVWADSDGNKIDPPKDVTVTALLWANGEPTDKSVVLNEENNWTAIFDNLPTENADGKIVYTITEVKIDGYITQIAVNEDGSITITNMEEPTTPTPPDNPTPPPTPIPDEPDKPDNPPEPEPEPDDKIDIPDEDTPKGGSGSIIITKIVTGDNEDAKSGSYTFDILNNKGVVVSSIVVKAGSSGTISNLDVGQYTVVERSAEINGYTLKVDITSNGVITILPNTEAKVFVINKYTSNPTPEEPKTDNPPQTPPDEDTTITITDEGTPLSNTPIRTVTTQTNTEPQVQEDKLVEIIDDATPLGFLPKTGNSINIAMICGIVIMSVIVFAIGLRLILNKED